MFEENNSSNSEQPPLSNPNEKQNSPNRTNIFQSFDNKNLNYNQDFPELEQDTILINVPDNYL